MISLLQIPTSAPSLFFNTVTLFHVGGTKFYQGSVIFNPVTKEAVRIFRYGRNDAFANGGGQIDLKIYHSNSDIENSLPSELVGASALIAASDSVNKKMGEKSTTKKGYTVLDVDSDLHKEVLSELSTGKVDKLAFSRLFFYGSDSSDGDIANFFSQFKEGLSLVDYSRLTMAVFSMDQGVNNNSAFRPPNVFTEKSIENALRESFGYDFASQIINVVGHSKEKQISPDEPLFDPTINRGAVWGGW